MCIVALPIGLYIFRFMSETSIGIPVANPALNKNVLVIYNPSDDNIPVKYLNLLYRYFHVPR